MSGHLNGGPVRIGIVGAGTIARAHLAVLRDLPGVTVAGITSRTRERAEALAREFGVPVCSADLETLMRETAPDGLMVLVSVDRMSDAAGRALACGVPVFLEKPPGLSPQEARDLAAAARRQGVPTMVGYNRRFYSVFHKGLEIVRRAGRLLGLAVEGHERMWRVRAGGSFSAEVLDRWLFANGTHTVDLLRFFGGEPREVFAIHESLREAAGDQFAATLRMENGALAQYTAHWYSPGGWGVVLYGEGVTVRFRPLERGVWVDRDLVEHPLEPDEEDLRYKPGFHRQAEAFRDLIRTGRPVWPALDLEGACATMDLAARLAGRQATEAAR